MRKTMTDRGVAALKPRAAQIALSFNVDHSTISRLKARHAAEMI